MIDAILNLIDFLKLLYQKAFQDDIFSRAAQVAFYFSFSLFPLLFFLVSLFGIVLESTVELKGELYAYLRQLMPWTAFDLVQKTVEEIIANSSGGKLTLGIVITVWSASAGMDSLRVALNAVYGFREKRSWFTTKALSIGMTIALTALSGIVLALVFYGWQLVRIGAAAIGIEITSPLVLVTVEWITILAVMLFACELIYNLMPSFPTIRWRWITSGSIVAIVLWLILTTAFRLYLEYFNSYNRTYGSLGAVIILMLWLYMTALVVLIGGAINAALRDLGERRGLEAAASAKVE